MIHPAILFVYTNYVMLNHKNNIYSSKKIEITAKVKLFVVDQKKNKIHNHSTHFFKIMFFLISLWQTYKHIPNNKLCAISFLMARLTYLITPIAARRNKDKYILLNDFSFLKEQSQVADVIQKYF